MPYNVANSLAMNFADPIGIDQLKQRNALAQRDQNLQEQNAFAQQDYYKAQQANMLRDDQRQDLARKDAQSKEWLTNAIGHARQNPAIAPQLIAQGKQMGYVPPDFPDQIGPDEIENIAMELGVAPPPMAFEKTPDYQKLRTQHDFRIKEEQEQGRQSRLTAATKPTSSYVALTPQEIAAAGLPPGSSAQRDTATGKIDVLGKRDTTGVLSQKDATTAKQKMTTIKLARQQLNKIRESFDTGRKGINAFGPGQGLLPTQQGKQFDARVNQMRSTLTALTRVPGVGAMSDYETKLDQSKFPSRNSYESVTDDTLNNLDDMLNLLETGYSDLLSGAAPQSTQRGAPPQQPQAAPTQEITATGPNGQKLILRNGQWVPAGG